VLSPKHFHYNGGTIESQIPLDIKFSIVYDEEEKRRLSQASEELSSDESKEDINVSGRC
jgi:hypothetical protein